MTPKEASKILEETPIRILNKADVFKYTLAIEIASDALMFKDYFDNLYGIGLEVQNWHLNGDAEPFDNFYDDAINWK